MKLLLLATLAVGAFGAGQQVILPQSSKTCLSDGIHATKNSCALYAELQACQASQDLKTVMVVRTGHAPLMFATGTPGAAFADLTKAAQDHFSMVTPGHSLVFKYQLDATTAGLHPTLAGYHDITNDQQLAAIFGMPDRFQPFVIEPMISTLNPTDMPTVSPTVDPSQMPSVVPTTAPTPAPVPWTDCFTRKVAGSPSGVYDIGSGISGYCFMDDVAPVHTGGGWTVLMKMAPNTQEFTYYSTMFTDNTSTLNYPANADAQQTDFKHPYFNTQQYTEFALYFPSWQTSPNGFYYQHTGPTTAYDLFNGPQIRISGSTPGGSYGTGTPRNDIPWNLDYLSTQSGYKLYGINIYEGAKTHGNWDGGFAIRWGAAHNNEGTADSNDVGCGVGYSGYYSGLHHDYPGFVDWHYCCEEYRSSGPGFTRVTTPNWTGSWGATTMFQYGAFIMAR